MNDQILEREGLSICSAEYNRIFLDVLQDNGVDIMSWLQRVALDFEVMNKVDGFMLYKDIEGFFTRNVETLGVDGLGIDMGIRTDITSHGSLSYAVLSSPHYEDGFMVFQRFLKLRTNFLDLALDFSDESVTFKFKLTENMTDYVSRFYLECAISGTHTFISQYLKGKTFFADYKFAYSEPSYGSRYSERFGSAVQFNSNETSFTIKRKYLDQVDVCENNSIYVVATQQCEAELEQFEKAQCIVSKIKTMLFESPWVFPTQEQVANHFSVSIRTLRRKLSDAGTTYQSILDSVRESMAKQYLQNTSWYINEIADMVGYSEPSNFKRAFKRWSGHTPNEYRKLCHCKDITTLAIAN